MTCRAPLQSAKPSLICVKIHDRTIHRIGASKMADEVQTSRAAAFKLQRAIDPERDHVRGGKPGKDVVGVLADQAFPPGSYSAIAKIGVLVGSVLAAALGAAILVINPKTRAATPAP